MAGTGAENTIWLKNVRLAFPHLWKPQKNDDGEPVGYNCTFIISPDDPQVKAINALIDKVAKEFWKDKADAMLKQLRAADKVAIHNGDAKAQFDGYAGNFYVNARSPTKPLVIDRDKTILTSDDGKPYSGCYVDGNVQIWVQSNAYGKRINAGLRIVQFRKDGDAFTSMPAASLDEVPDISAEDEDDENTAPDM